jgi:hypothetical protein
MGRKGSAYANSARDFDAIRENGTQTSFANSGRDFDAN